MFATDKDRAIAYAAMRTLERMLNQDGDFPPGYSQDISGATITIVLPQGSIVERDKGINGDGTILKKATQNLYGYALWALLITRLKKFNQWNVVRQAMLDSMKEVVSRSSKNLKAEILKEFPEVAQEIEALQEQLEIPARIEETPRVFKEPKIPATVTIQAK